jgi:hypothetical protein
MSIASPIQPAGLPTAMEPGIDQARGCQTDTVFIRTSNAGTGGAMGRTIVQRLSPHRPLKDW